MSEFHVSIAGKRYAAALTRHLTAAREILKPALQELSVAIVADRQMALLHQRFLGIFSPTDVLTFELEYDRRGQVLAGEVVICRDEAARQCAISGVKLENELLLYALHGMLHLCGLDDRTKRGFEAMHRTEDAILTQLGIGPTFHFRRGRRNQKIGAR